MTTPRVEDIIADLRNLPSLPTVVMELLQTMGDEDVNIDRLAHGISNDQALAARTLRVANSPFYGMQGRIDTIAEAITVLGFVNVRSLVTTAGIATAWPTREAAGFEPRMFWRHGLGVACCASTLAQLAGLRPDRLFLAGLLHDIGRLVLVATHPAAFEEILRRRRADDCALIEAERGVLGFDHAAIGAALCRHWRIPESIADAVDRHHRPRTDSTDQPAEPADVVHIADVLSHALDLADDPQAMVPPPEPAAWHRLGLGREKLRTLLRQIESQFGGFSSMVS